MSVFLFKKWIVVLFLGYRSFVHILVIRSVLDIHHANIFSQSIACFLIFVTMSFEVQSFRFYEI